ncbi:ATP-binding protein [Chloroflexota bacterium]
MWQIIGQEDNVGLLRACLESDSLAHAYILTGPPHVGKMALAINLAQAVNCTGDDAPCQLCPSCRRVLEDRHADVEIIGVGTAADDGASKSMIYIEQIQQLQTTANLAPFEGRYRVYIINGAEHLSVPAANCLLKTLEEPPEHVLMLLLAENEQAVLETVLSRCQHLELRPMPATILEAALMAEGAGADQPGLVARLAEGCAGWAKNALADPRLLEGRSEVIDQLENAMADGLDGRFALARKMAGQYAGDHDRIFRTLKTWQSYFRDLLLVKTGGEVYLTNIDRERIMESTAAGLSAASIVNFTHELGNTIGSLRLNANPQLAMEVLMLEMPVKGAGGKS